MIDPESNVDRKLSDSEEMFTSMKETLDELESQGLLSDDLLKEIRAISAEHTVSLQAMESVYKSALACEGG